MEDNKDKNLDQNENNEKMYTEAEFQAEIDRRVTMALKKAERKKEEAVKEAKKLAEMDAEDRRKYELEQKEKELAEKEKQLAMMENRVEASKALALRGISVDLVDLVISDDADQMMENIKKLEKNFKESVSTQIKELTKDTAPKKNIDNGEMTQEKFSALSLIEQSELLSKHPDYEKFI